MTRSFVVFSSIDAIISQRTAALYPHLHMIPVTLHFTPTHPIFPEAVTISRSWGKGGSNKNKDKAVSD
jgi:hypothetical protein